MVALSGTSYAAVKITGSNIADGTVTTKDVKNKSLCLKDLSPATKGKLKSAPCASGGQERHRTRGTRREDGPSYARSAYDNTDTNITNQVNVTTPA